MTDRQVDRQTDKERQVEKNWDRRCVCVCVCVCGGGEGGAKAGGGGGGGGGGGRYTDLIDVKVLDNGIKGGVQVVEEIYHLPTRKGSKDIIITEAYISLSLYIYQKSYMSQ